MEIMYVGFCGLCIGNVAFRNDLRPTVISLEKVGRSCMYNRDSSNFRNVQELSHRRLLFKSYRCDQDFTAALQRSFKTP